MVFWDTSKEEEDELVKKAYEMISKYEMEVPAVLLLESIKPLAFVGGGLLRISLSPFMMLFWNKGQALIDTFEKRRNIEKLIKMLEGRYKDEEAGKEVELEGGEKAVSDGEPPKEAKKGWRRFFRFL